MLLDRLRVRRVAAQPLLRVFLQQLRMIPLRRTDFLENIGRVGREIGRNIDGRLLDLVEQSLLVAAIEGRLRVTPASRTHPSGQHFVQQRAQTPPVHRLSVPGAVQDLRSEVFRRAAEGLRASIGLRDAFFAQPEVGESHVALLGQQHVLRLQIAAIIRGEARLPVDDALLVEILQRQRDLRRVVARPVLRELLRLAQMVEQLASGTVVQHEIQLIALRLRRKDKRTV